MCWSCNGARHDTGHPFPHEIQTSAQPRGQLVRKGEERRGEERRHEKRKKRHSSIQSAKRTDGVSTAEGFVDRLIQLWVQGQFELQQIYLHLAMLHVQTVLHHLPACTHTHTHTHTHQEFMEAREDGGSGVPVDGPGPLGETVPGSQLVPGGLR